MLRRNFFGSLIVLCSFFCGSAALGNPVTKSAVKDLNVYVVGSFSGIMPFLAEGIFGATKAFVDQTNAEGGLLGRKLVIHRLDDQADLAKASENAKIPLNDPDHLITVGHPFSSIALPLGKIYAKRGKILLTPYATNAEISKIGATVFQLCFNDEFQGKTLAAVAVKNLRGKKILVLRNISDPYSDGLSAVFLSEFDKISAEKKIKREEFRYIFDKLDYDKLSKTIADFEPDVLFLPELKVRAAEILRQLMSRGITSPQILGADGWGSEDGTLDLFFSGAGQSKTGRYFYTYHWHPDIKNKENEAAKAYLKKATGKEAYGPGVLTFEALEHLKSIVKAIRSVENLELAERMRGSKFKGATGKVSFNKDGQTERNLVLIELTKKGLKYDSLAEPVK